MKRSHHRSLKVLLVDDDAVLGKMMTTGLRQKNYEVSVIGDYSSASAFIEKHLDSSRKGGGAGDSSAFVPDVFIIDYNLGTTKTGLDLCKKIRRRSNAPGLMLSATEALDTMVACLDAGADHYIHKSSSLREIVSRINSCSRNRLAVQSSASTVKTPWVTLMCDERLLVSSTRKVQLTEQECLLAQILLMNRNSALAKEDIHIQVYGDYPGTQSRKLDVLIGRLRKKISAVKCRYRIFSERSFGYKLVEISHDRA